VAALRVVQAELEHAAGAVVVAIRLASARRARERVVADGELAAEAGPRGRQRWRSERRVARRKTELQVLRNAQLDGVAAARLVAQVALGSVGERRLLTALAAGVPLRLERLQGRRQLALGSGSDTSDDGGDGGVEP
jgi:hypothetical protein